MTHYVSWEGGDVQSVDDDHFTNVLCELVNGRRYLRHGFTEVSESDARKAHPQLFGQPDGRVDAQRTDDELAREFQRRQLLQQMRDLGGAL